MIDPADANNFVRKVYVAAPYRRHPFVREVHAMLTAVGITPTSRWAMRAEISIDDAMTAFEIDRADIGSSDGMLALLNEPDGKETYCEIEVARSMGMPIVWVDGFPDYARDRDGIVLREKREEIIRGKQAAHANGFIDSIPGNHEPMSLHFHARSGLACGHQDVDGAISTITYVRKIPRGLTIASLDDVLDERVRQDRKWGRVPGVWTNDPGIKLAVLTEEVGEVARAVLERSPMDHLKNELIQVAAVAVAWAECIDARTEQHREISIDDQECQRQDQERQEFDAIAPR